MTRLLKLLEPFCLLAVPSVLLLCAWTGAEHTALLTFVAVVFSFVPFFWRFERQRPSPQTILPVVVLSAVAAAGRVLFAMLPNVKPMAAVVIVAGLCLGRQSGFLTGALAALASNFFFGQGPWTPWQMYALGLIGYLAGVLRTVLQNNRPAACLFGFFSVLLYGLILDSWYVVGFIQPLTWPAALAAYAAGIPFTLFHAVSTVLFLLLIQKSWTRKIRRIQQKFGL